MSASLDIASDDREHVPSGNRPVAWEPQKGPQTSFVSCPVFEVFFGGSRGGGKTDAVLGEWLQHAADHGPNAIGLMVRRTRIELLETFERARLIYSKIGAQVTYSPMRIVMPGGGRITYAYLERDSDAESYQGASFSRVYVEEVGNFPSPAPIMKLMATLRSGAGVPVGMRLTGNPGGAGHQWVRARYIDPAPQGWKVLRDKATGLQRIYIPSRVADNKYLGGDYVQRLRASGSPELVRAWLEGDWSVVSGAFFPEFSMDRHVIPPRSLPTHWARFRSFDWGSARPFACHWWAVSDGSMSDIARGALVNYREWYGMKPSEPNVGLKMTAEAVAQGIKARETDDPVPMVGVADPAMFAEDGGPSIAQRMIGHGVIFRPADNKRVPQRGAMGGWDQVRARLTGDAEGMPMLLLFATSRDLIRTLPALQHDDARPEDVDSDMEDHAPDSCFVAGTLVETARGPVPIERVCLGDSVATRIGLCNVTAVFSVGERDVFDVQLSDGTVLTGTSNHPIWVEGRGFISLSALRYGDMMRPCASLSSAIPSRSSGASDTICAAATISTVGRGFIGLFGRRITVAFRSALTSTTRITTSTTTSLRTWFAFAARSISPITAGYALVSPPQTLPLTHVRAPLRGTDQRMARNGTASIGPSIARMPYTVAANASASSVAPYLTDWTGRLLGFAPMPVSRVGVAYSVSTTWSANARVAGRSSSLTGLWMACFARKPATELPHQVNMSGIWHDTVAIIAAARSKRAMPAQSGVPTVVGEPTTAGRQRVYNLSVDQAEEYFANGILVHNCRYACMSRPFVRDAVKPKVPDTWDRAWRDASRSGEAAVWRVA